MYHSLQLLLGNQQHILTVHFHVSPFAFPLGRILVLLQQAVLTFSELSHTLSPTLYCGALCRWAS